MSKGYVRLEQTILDACLYRIIILCCRLNSVVWCIIGTKIPKSSVIHKNALKACLFMVLCLCSLVIMADWAPLLLVCVSLQDSLLYFWLGLVRLLSNWKKYMWGRKLQEEFGCVFNCHLSVLQSLLWLVPEKRVLGALVEELCFIEWLFQQHDARNFGNDLLSGNFPLPRKSEQNPRTSECLTSGVSHVMMLCTKCHSSSN